MRHKVWRPFRLPIGWRARPSGAVGWVSGRIQRWGYGKGRTALERSARAVALEAERRDRMGVDG